MAIYGIGAYFGDHDISDDFIKYKLIGVGWPFDDAPDLHEMVKSLKTGDIVFLKKFSLASGFQIKSVGIVADSEIIQDTDQCKILQNDSLPIARHVKWLWTSENWVFITEDAGGKNNVRLNSVFEEFNPYVQWEIVEKLRNPSEANDG
jgi:hypothetical protein